MKQQSGLRLSSLEQYVMLAVLRQNGSAYGVSIREDIEERTKRTVSFGAIYAALDRLDRDGLIESRAGEPTAERGGRRKTYFRLNAKGQRALNASLADLGAMLRGAGVKEAFS